MGGMGLILNPVIVSLRCLLGPLAMLGLMAGASCTHSYIFQTVLTEGITYVWLPIIVAQ